MRIRILRAFCGRAIHDRRSVSPKRMPRLGAGFRQVYARAVGSGLPFAAAARGKMNRIPANARQNSGVRSICRKKAFGADGLVGRSILAACVTRQNFKSTPFA